MIAELKTDWLPAMDSMLVKALLTAGYSANELKKVLDNHKPDSLSSNTSYGEVIINTVNKQLKNNVIAEVKDITRVRMPSMPEENISE